ncbi:MAG: hypothetical protein MUF31_14360 [Akkermansiaceae bacterium]|jgi:hypothetical protein|nr:hypothetical protein [Akkermansiaceae bacterium]
MNPPAVTNHPHFRRKVFIASIGAAAVLGAALITARCSRMEQPDPPQPASKSVHRILLNDKGTLLREDLRIVGSNQYEKTFTSGDIEVPMTQSRAKYYVYEAKKLIGAVLIPSGLEDDLILIEVKVESDYWQPEA